MKANITKKYKTIIGNPPYVKKSTGNLYLEFIKKCFHLLKIKGELIFIVPSDFLKLTKASNLLNNMLKVGTFTHIYHPNNENLFDNASIDVIVFRYYNWHIEDNQHIIVGQKRPKKTLYNNDVKYLINTNGTVTFSDTEIINSSIIGDYFNVYVPEESRDDY